MNAIDTYCEQKSHTEQEYHHQEKIDKIASEYSMLSMCMTRGVFFFYCKKKTVEFAQKRVLSRGCCRWNWLVWCEIKTARRIYMIIIEKTITITMTNGKRPINSANIVYSCKWMRMYVAHLACSTNWLFTPILREKLWKKIFVSLHFYVHTNTTVTLVMAINTRLEFWLNVLFNFFFAVFLALNCCLQ